MHTSSAVHIRIVFGQLRTFWNQLAWPDAETAYVFVSRILDDICKGKYLYVPKTSFPQLKKCFANKLPFWGMSGFKNQSKSQNILIV
jgi:hypothetical protein